MMRSSVVSIVPTRTTIPNLQTFMMNRKRKRRTEMANYLTEIRLAIKRLTLAYKEVQSLSTKAGVPDLLRLAEGNVSVAKHALIDDMAAKGNNASTLKPEDHLFAEWRKYSVLAANTLGSTSPESLANRAICDQLQYLLQ